MIVVRGDDLNPLTARRQAELFRRRYPTWGRWGLSAYAAGNEAEIEDLAADQLERFPELVLYSRADLEAAGFAVIPTFRSPHVTVAFVGDLDVGLEALVATRHERRVNPYHDGTESWR